MNQDSEITPPTNIEGIAIHLGYLAKAVDKLDKKLDAVIANAVNRDEWLEHVKWNSNLETRTSKLEEKMVITEITISNNRTAIYVAGIILGGLFAFLQFILPYLINHVK